MQDYLHQKLERPALQNMSALGFAHIGDGVYELLTRTYLVTEGLHTAKNLHKQTTRLVCAQAQAEATEVIRPLLTEEESDIYRRGRNAKPGSVPKSCTHGQYAHATALECLFGWLYLSAQFERINELFHAIVQSWA